MATKKSFDAVEMSRRGKERVSRLLSKMSPKEEEDYFKRRMAEIYGSEKSSRKVLRKKKTVKT